MSVRIVCEKGESSGIVTLMELDWYSKKVFASNSARRVATLTSFMGIVSLVLLHIDPGGFRVPME